MAHQLTEELYEHAPADLGSAEMVVLGVIAYHAQVTHRRCWMTAEEMQRRSRLSATGLRQVLQRLGKRGLECRVPQGVGRDGRPIYAFRGRSTVFQMPRLATTAAADRPGSEPAPSPGSGAQWKGDATQPLSVVNRGGNGDVRQAPIGRNGDVSESPFTEKGDVYEPERRLPDVAQYERNELQGEDEQQRSRPRAVPAPDRPPRRRPPGTPAGPGRPQPVQPPLLAPVPAPDDAVVLAAAPSTAPAAGPVAGSLCGRADCRAPGPCWACGAARQRGVDAAAAQERRLREQERERAAARRAAAASCPHGCEQGYLGTRVCDHQPRRSYQQMGGWHAVRAQLAARARDRGDRPSRHRAPTARHRAS